MATRQMLPFEGGRYGDTTHSVVVWDQSNPQSLLSLVSDSVRECILSARDTRPEWFDLNERELLVKLREKRLPPTPADNRIRLNFWFEYGQAIAEGRKMNMAALYSNVMTEEAFYTRYVKRPENLAWMLTPPASYNTVIEEALQFGLEQLRDVLELPNLDSKGRVNTKLIELKARVVAMLDQRVKGAIVQRSMQVQVHATDKAAMKMATELTMEDIERRLAELHKKDRLAQPEPPAPDPNVIEVELTK